MKLYTANYDADRPSTKSVEVPLNSTVRIGVGVKYEGEDVEVKQNEIVLKDSSGNTIEADDTAADDKYAVFTLNTDDNEGYDKYSVESTTDGMTVKELTFDPSTSLTAGKGVINAELPEDWIGVELYCNPTPSANYDYSKNPFQCVAKTEDNTERWGMVTYFLNAEGNSVAVINNQTSGFVDKYQQFWIANPDGTITKSATWTITPDVKSVYVNISVPSQFVTASIYQTYAKRIQRQFDLMVNKSDLGEIEGYGDKYIIDQTATLSGTYADGSDFSFTVPVVEEPDSSDSELIGG